MTLTPTRRGSIALGLAFAAALVTGAFAPAAADTLENVTKTGVLRVGIFEDFPPFASLNTSMKIEGYDTEVADKLAAALGRQGRTGRHHRAEPRSVPDGRQGRCAAFDRLQRRTGASC